MNRRALLKMLASAPGVFVMPLRTHASTRRDALYPLVGPYNGALRKKYPIIYRYLNVVDIGHAELGETLLAYRGDEAGAVRRLEEVAFERVRKMFLDPSRAPRLAPAEETVAPESVKVAWRLNQAFDWAHILHRQIYDILATDFSTARKQTYIRESYAWYRSEREIVFPGRLKTHDLMEHQWFSQYWRRKYPRFNGAIWAYHWYQLRLNEVMLEPEGSARGAKISAATAELRAMFENPDLLPRHMPMAHTISPGFLAEFPEIANTFDNLHSFHDIYNDILAHPQIIDKQEEVYRQLDVYFRPGQAIETAPMHPLPSDLSPADHRQLNRLEHLEHMAMMVMSSPDEQLAFLRKPHHERAATLDSLKLLMARTWPNFEKKHAELGHGAHSRHSH